MQLGFPSGPLVRSDRAGWADSADGEDSDVRNGHLFGRTFDGDGRVLTALSTGSVLCLARTSHQ